MVASAVPAWPGRAPASRAATSVSSRKRDVRLVEPFGWDREHAGDQVGVFGMPQGGVAEQGVDRGRAGRCGCGRCCRFGLEVVQERRDGLGVEVGQVQP